MLLPSLFLIGVMFGFVGTVLGATLMLRAARRLGRSPVLHRPVPVDPSEVRLERLRRVDAVLWVALGKNPVTELTQ
jgi:hypothetical protein